VTLSWSAVVAVMAAPEEPVMQTSCEVDEEMTVQGLGPKATEFSEGAVENPVPVMVTARPPARLPIKGETDVTTKGMTMADLPLQPMPMPG
jgi:hypothetical protein